MRSSDGFNLYCDHNIYPYIIKEETDASSAYKIMPEQIKEINQARLNLQKKMDYKIDNIEVLDYKENKKYMADVTVKIQVLDTLAMEEQVENFIKKEAPQRISNYKPGEFFGVKDTKVRPSDNQRMILGKLLTDAVLYSIDNPIFKEEMIPIHFIYKNYEDGKILLDIDSSLEIQRTNDYSQIDRLFWNNHSVRPDGQSMFFDKEAFALAIKNKRI